jgi:hypothetical protein
MVVTGACAVAATHAEVNLAGDKLEPARTAPVPQVLGLGPCLEYKSGRRMEGTPEDDDRLVWRRQDVQALAGHDGFTSFWRSSK